MHRKLWLHQVVLFATLLGLSTWRVVFGNGSLDMYLMWWFIGGVFGFGFIFLDRVVHLFMSDQEEPFVKFVRALYQRKLYGQVFKVLLLDRKAPQRLFMRSALFLGVWLLFGLLTVTSSTSPFGRGFVLGMGLHLVFDLLTDYFGQGREIELWFWQIKRKLEQQEIVAVVWAFVILFAVIGLTL